MGWLETRDIAPLVSGQPTSAAKVSSRLTFVLLGTSSVAPLPSRPGTDDASGETVFHRPGVEQVGIVRERLGVGAEHFEAGHGGSPVPGAFRSPRHLQIIYHL